MNLNEILNGLSHYVAFDPAKAPSYFAVAAAPFLIGYLLKSRYPDERFEPKVELLVGTLTGFVGITSALFIGRGGMQATDTPFYIFYVAGTALNAIMEHRHQKKLRSLRIQQAIQL